MTDRLITLGLAGASPEARQAAEAADVKRRLAALERTGADVPIGSVVPYGGLVPTSASFTINGTWSTYGSGLGSSSYGYLIAQMAENSTYVFLQTFAVIVNIGTYVYSPVIRFTKSSKTAARVGASGREWDLGPSGGGTHSALVSDAYTAFSKGSNLTADDTYVYYTQPSQADADIRQIYRLSVTAGSTTTGSEWGQCPSGRYITHLAATPAGVGTRYLYAVCDNQQIYRSLIGSAFSSASSFYTAPAGTSITSLDVVGPTTVTDHTPGDLYIGLSDNTIVRTDAGGSARTEGGSASKWTLSALPYSVTASDSHIYFSNYFKTGRITLNPTASTATSADTVEENLIDLPPGWSSSQVAGKTGTNLFYVSGSSIGRVTDAEVLAVDAELPDGFVLCDGSTLSREQYPDLFNAIGTTFNDSTTASDSFDVPVTNALVHAYIEGGAQSITGGLATPTAVTLASQDNTDGYITNKFYSASTPTRVTVPAGYGGVYRLDAQIRFSASAVAGQRTIGILKNGTELLEYSSSTSTSASAGLGRVRANGLITLAAGDYLEIGASTSATLTCPAAHIWLQLVSQPRAHLIKY